MPYKGGHNNNNKNIKTNRTLFKIIVCARCVVVIVMPWNKKNIEEVEEEVDNVVTTQEC